MDQSAQNPRSMLRRLSPASVAQTTSSNSSARSSPVSVVAKAIKYLMAVKTAEALIVRINGEETLLIKLDSAQPFSVTGSFCDLFRGTDTYRRKYALKRCRFTDQPYADAPQQRIETEARRWQALTHDHLLRFLGMTKDKYGFLYLISPWIDNGSLQEYIMRNPGCDRPKYLYQVACALVYLHGEDIIHGDVRARNVLVSQSGDALLCDFGLAGIISLTGSVGLKGGETLRRDSPELWEGNPRSFKSDVYAFGMTIYEVLSGRIPFYQYRNVPALIRAVISRGERPTKEPMESPDGNTYSHLWDIAEQCWTKDPDQRPSMAALEQLLNPENVTHGNEPRGATSSTSPDPQPAPLLEGELYAEPEEISLSELPPDELPPPTASSDDTFQTAKQSARSASSPVVQTALSPTRSHSEGTAATVSPVVAPSSRSNTNPVAGPRANRIQWAEDSADYTSKVQRSGALRRGSIGTIRSPVRGMSFLSRAVEGFFKVFDRRGESIDYTSSGLVDIHMGSIASPTDASGRVTIVYIRSLRLSAQSRSRDQLVTRLRRQVQEWKDLPANSRIVPYAGYAILDEIACVISEGFMVDLATYLEDPKTTRRPIVRQVAEGMCFLHSLNPSIIHGDLCDINVVVNDKGEAMIRNYGLWRLADEDRVRTGSDRSLLVRYAAPELTEGQKYTEKTDVWAFGCLALEILTKKSPKFTFHGKAQLRLLVYQGKRRALAVFPQLGEEACSTLQKCWDPTPLNRPSMDTLFEEIRRWPAVGRNPTTQEPTFVPGEDMQEGLTDALGSQSSLQLDRRPWTESPVPTSSDVLG